MWDSADLYALNIAKAARLKRKADRLKRIQSSRSYILTRLDAEIRLSQGKSLESTPKIYQARFVVSDIDTKDIHLFTEEPLVEGKEVKFTLEFPLRFYGTGIVKKSKIYNLNSKILNSQGTGFNYRTHIRFVPETESEKTAINQFVEKLKTHLMLRKRHEPHLFPVHK